MSLSYIAKSCCTDKPQTLKKAFLICGFLITFSGLANEQKQLEEIRDKISSQEQSISQKEAEQKKLKQRLSEQEKEVKEAETALKTIQKELKQSEAKIIRFNENLTNLNSSIEKQKILLKQQIDLAFKQGQSSSMEMLFSSADSQKNDRIVGYLAYLNRQREETITTIKTQEAEVAEQKTLIEVQLKNQQTLVTQQKEKTALLEKAKAEQAKILAALNQEVKKSKNQLVNLRDQEITLESKINQAIKAEARRKEEEQRKLAQDKTRDNPKNEANGSKSGQTANLGGLSTAKKQFAWPVAGRVTTRFGEQIQGEIVSKGLIIDAPKGSLVKAISEGEVLIADELQGYGLVIVIDHGSGDMSLYGFNETTNVKAGQKVSVGQIIGTVGNVEGEPYSALYFEIRREGSAINPAGFLR